MVDEFIDNSAILAAAVGTAVGGIAATIWRRRKEATDGVDRWYRDALAGGLGVDDEDLDVNEDALEEFGNHFSPESIEAGQPTSILEALNMPLDSMTEAVEDDDFWERMIQDSTTEFANVVLIEVAGDTYERMEQRKRSL